MHLFFFFVNNVFIIPICGFKMTLFDEHNMYKAVLRTQQEYYAASHIM